MSLLFKDRVSAGAHASRVNVLQRTAMFFVNHLRQALQSLGELWRQPVASLMTIGVLGLSITLPSTLYILVANVEKLSSGWQQASEISLFLETSVSQQQSKQLINRLSVWPEIERVVFVPKQDALAEFEQLTGLGEAIAYLDENPIPDLILITPTSQYASPTSAKMLLDKLLREREG